MSNKKLDFSKAKVGDKVWSFAFGHGVVQENEMNENDLYPIEVEFPNGDTTFYTVDGKVFLSDTRPALFWREFEIPEEAYRAPLPELEIDAKVWVRRRFGDKWFPRHFKNFVGDKVDCWDSGRTSFTSDNSDTSIWDEYSLTYPNEEKTND